MENSLTVGRATVAKRRPGFARYQRRVYLPNALLPVPQPLFRGRRLTQEEVFACICSLTGPIEPECPTHKSDSAQRSGYRIAA